VTHHGTVVAAVAGWHVLVAAVAAIVVLAGATLVLCGFSGTVAAKLVIGYDKRASTSKFQAAAWTYAICFALLTLLAGHMIFSDFDAGWNGFLKTGLNSDYLWLLGIPSAGLVGAKAITQTKATGDPAAKPAKVSADNKLSTRIRELGSNDADNDPQPELADLQYLIFNGIALLYFLSAFLGHVEKGLPSLPDSLIALTGVSAASYLAKKAATQTAAPVIASVHPRHVVLGAAPVPLTISGTGFIPEFATGKPAVMLAAWTSTSWMVRRRRNSSPTFRRSRRRRRRAWSPAHLTPW
jgi:hypothetical protein